jgi:O-antigen/teichoic acid export membrane protein
MTITKLSYKSIFDTWWPLAASWMLMAIELPIISAFVARLENPEINLAAYGGIVFPLALIIESPVIMLLAASTALSKDWDSYKKLRRFMIVTSATFTALHILLAFTPLYYVIVEGLIGAPEEIVEPARIGLMIMTPWTWAIAYRRFNQGVLIRFGHSKTVTVGTVIRLFADLLVLIIGYSLGTVSGIVVASSAVIAGVFCEAIYVGIVKEPVIKNQLKPAPPVDEPLTRLSFLQFYIPLAMTSLLTLLFQPIGSAALSRMPQPLTSLAVWPVISGLIFFFRSMGMAYNEAVIALLDKPRSFATLRRFTIGLSTISSASLLIIAATPLAEFWFERISGLSPELVEIALIGILIAVLLPALNVWVSWFQGNLVYSRFTRAVTEAVVVFLMINTITLSLGVYYGEMTGLYVSLASFGISTFAQTIWLWYRSRTSLKTIQQRDEAYITSHVAEASAN